MTATATSPRCDACYNIATQNAVDMQMQKPVDGDTLESYKPKGRIKYGCNLHPVFSETYDENGQRLCPQA